MSTYSTADIRNVLLVGHAGSGKTTLAEALLHATGTTTRSGSVSDGNTVSDFEKEEKEHGHSIYSAVLHLDHAGRRINLIDTPGSPDLIGAALACLPAVETVVVVINASAGIEITARRLMDAARLRNLPRAIVINRIDAAEADLEKLVEQIQEQFGSACLPINLPTEKNSRVTECLLNSKGTSDILDVQAAHTAILDQIVEIDEGLMERYLSGEEPDYSALHAPFERAMDEAHVVPILFTNARDGVGIPELLEAIAQHFPSPEEGNLRPFLTGEGDNERPFAYHNDPALPLLAHVFKVSVDPFVGKLAIFRIHQGKCGTGAQVYVGHSKKPIKLGHLFQLHGKEHREVPLLIAGDIGAVAKIDDIHLNDVLHDDHALDSVHLKPLAFPTPMFGLAITPKSRGDDQKITQTLTRLAEEDPTFKWTNDPQTHEIVIHGIGELHLRLILERLANRGLHVDSKPPKIAYRETIASPAEGHHRHKKQSGGAGQFGEVFLRVEPLDRGKGFEFVNEVFGGSIPGQFIPAIEKGVREVLDTGIVAGYPVQDVRVVVYDGKHHPVDSKEVAFKAAGRMAFKDAFLKARPALLEPLVTVEVTVPADKVGAVTGDLSGKRGHIHNTDVSQSGTAVISAIVPLSEVMQYQGQLKSVTGGQGSFAMEFSHYEAVPTNLQQQIIAQYKPQAEPE